MNNTPLTRDRITFKMSDTLLTETEASLCRRIDEIETYSLSLKDERDDLNRRLKIATEALKLSQLWLCNTLEVAESRGWEQPLPVIAKALAAATKGAKLNE